MLYKKFNYKVYIKSSNFYRHVVLLIVCTNYILFYYDLLISNHYIVLIFLIKGIAFLLITHENNK